MTKVIIYSDFDGIATNRPGSATVFSPFYASLLQSAIIQDNYKDPLMKGETEVQALFEEKFGKYDEHFDFTKTDADMLISRDAVTFFHEVLKNDQITLKFITKNRKDYIQAMLQYQGFTSEEINRIAIFDSGLKSTDVFHDLMAQPNKNEVSHVYVLDDSPSDFAQMVRGVQFGGFKNEQIRQYNKKPGQFEWARYQQDIQQLFPVATETTDETAHQTTITATQLSDEKSSPVVASETQPRLSDTLINSAEEENQPLLPQTVKASDNYRTLKIAGYSSAIGFSLGFIVSAVLVGTGIFAPFGSGLLGVLALSLPVTASASVLSGAIGYGIAKNTAPVTQEQQATTAENSHQVMQQLGGASSMAQTQTTSVASPVEHFPNPLERAIVPSAEETPHAKVKPGSR